MCNWVARFAWSEALQFSTSVGSWDYTTTNRTVICVWEYPRHKLPSWWVLSILPWCKYPPFLQQHRAGQSHHRHLALSVRAPHYRHPTEWACGSLHIIRCTQLAVWQPDFPFYACYCASRWLWKRCQTVTHSHIWLHLSCHHLPRAKALLCVLHTNPGTLLENPTCKPFWIIKQNTRPHSTALLVLILCSDIQTNPGPRHSCGSARAHLCPRSAPLHSIYPCGYCQKPVMWSTPSVCGGYCDVWFHAPWVDLSQSEYSLLSHESQSWHCYRCNSHNISTVYHQYNIATWNSFAVLSISDTDNVFDARVSPGPTETLDARALAPQLEGSTRPHLPRTSSDRKPAGPPRIQRVL